MKKMNQYLLLAACAIGVVALSNKLTAGDIATPSMPGCCMGGMATVMSDSSTNAVPDLLKTCPVSGEKLGEMGKPFTFAYKGQEVNLCCKSCKKDFDKDPAKYMKLIRAADPAQKK
jgi:YHS domain-containing protein